MTNNLLIDVPAFVYHVTDKKNLKSILSDGLKARTGVDGCPVPYIYTFVNLKDAEGYVGKSRSRIILKIKTSGIPERVMSHHDMGLINASDIIRFTCNLKSDRIEVL